MMMTVEAWCCVSSDLGSHRSMCISVYFPCVHPLVCLAIPNTLATHRPCLLCTPRGWRSSLSPPGVAQADRGAGGIDDETFSTHTHACPIARLRLRAIAHYCPPCQRGNIYDRLQTYSGMGRFTLDTRTLSPSTVFATREAT